MRVAVVVGVLLGLYAVGVFSQEARSSPLQTRGVGDIPLELDVDAYSGVFRLSSGDIEYINSDNTDSFRITILVDGEVHLLNDSYLFSTQVDENALIPSIVWDSGGLVVHLIFFTIDEHAIQISLGLYNRTRRELKVGGRLLFDTVLDESETGAIYLNDTPYNQESDITLDEEIITVESHSAQRYKFSDTIIKGLVLAVRGEHITPPDRVLIANHRRLSRNPWFFRVISGRDLTYPPYTDINSGVALYYDPVAIPAGERRVYQIVIGNDVDRTYAAYPYNIALQALLGRDYSILLRLLDKIDSAIDFVDERQQQDGDLDTQDINTLIRTLQETREGLRTYDDAQQ